MDNTGKLIFLLDCPQFLPRILKTYKTLFAISSVKNIILINLLLKNQRVDRYVQNFLEDKYQEVSEIFTEYIDLITFALRKIK